MVVTDRWLFYTGLTVLLSHLKTNHQTNEAMIDDPETKDRGYCLSYEQRKDVTAEIRKGTKSGCLSLQQVTKK